MYLEYKLRTRDQARRLLTDIMNFRFDSVNFEDSLITWEALIAKYERTSGKRCDEDVLISVIQASATGALKDHLTLCTDSYTT